VKSKPSVLIIGGSGFLGRTLVPLFALQGHVHCTHCQHPFFPDSLPFDIYHDDIRPLLERTEISTIVFAALVEKDAPEIVRPAMERFVRGCRDCRFVYLSSDGIFDGERGQYTEGDEPTPCTRYGKNLLFCETLVKELCSDYCIIRPSYIYGFSAGRLDFRLSRTRERLEQGEHIEFFDDMYKSPLGVWQVAEAVADLSLSSYVGTLHVAGERLSLFELHRQAMRALNVDTTRLTPALMPSEPGFLRDTSLDSSAWQTLAGTQPLSVHETLIV
jgi:dTDP-4-dehydrorhamnose reductase